jgi:sulfur carrier protein
MQLVSNSNKKSYIYLHLPESFHEQNRMLDEPGKMLANINRINRIGRVPVIRLSVNGESRQFPQPLTCAGLIAALGLTGQRVAIECNGEIVPRGRHAEHSLTDGDNIEIVVAVGGG